MRRALARAWIATVAACLLAAPSHAGRIDRLASEIGFTLTTRWGQTLRGRFPEYSGELRDLPDGRRQVRLWLSAADVRIAGNARYTRLTRGSGFFDAAQYPRVTFVSEPYDEALLHDGGPLVGTLVIRDVQRRETFTVLPAECPRPGRDCDVVATGVIDRADYGMDRWNVALAPEVRFQLRIRIRGGDA
ncbi:YceI family protein [Luteimonas sp. MC1782]|uniref:YceI family protein n=1 Tax=Luteimonas sp. MC1782 TaxID=2760305 RepID=UPI0016016291|nr:YceI family protein [Luteimonas sp. MC1782]